MFNNLVACWNRFAAWSSRFANPADCRVWVHRPCGVAISSPPTADVPDNTLFRAGVLYAEPTAIGLVLPSPFPPGAFLSIQLPRPADEPACVVLASVVSCCAQPPGEWAVDCIFPMELQDEDLETFGARRQPAPAGDQRLWQRFPCQAQASFQEVEAADLPSLPAEVVDISACGVGLIMQTSPSDVGMVVRLNLPSPQSARPRQLMAWVSRITPQGEGRWAVGCRFVKELGEQELQGVLSAGEARPPRIIERAVGVSSN